MSDKKIETTKNIELEDQSVLKDEDLQEQGQGLMDISSDERYIELEIEKELERISKEIVYDDDSIAQMINSDEFQLGCKESSFLCGYYTNLLNSGLSNQQAYEITINIQTCNHNRKLQEIINANQLEIAKAQVNIIKDQTL